MPDTVEPGAVIVGAPRLSQMVRAFFRNRAAAIGAAILFCIVVMALFGEAWAPYGPNVISRDLLAPPSDAHIMGTDILGRDVFSRVLAGAQATLIVGLGAALVGGIIGISVGAVAGFKGGWLDTVMMRFAELIQVIPNFFLAILVVALFGAGLDRVVLVIGFLSWPGIARLTRGQFMAIKEQSFVEAGRSIGMPSWRLMLYEILPNAFPPLIVQLSFDVAAAIIVEAGLGFLGLSDPAFLTWGAMLHDAQRFLIKAWWLALFPGLAILLTVASLNLLGDGLNDYLNPRLRRV